MGPAGHWWWRSARSPRRGCWSSARSPRAVLTGSSQQQTVSEAGRIVGRRGRLGLRRGRRRGRLGWRERRHGAESSPRLGAAPNRREPTSRRPPTRRRGEPGGAGATAVRTVRDPPTTSAAAEPSPASRGSATAHDRAARQPQRLARVRGRRTPARRRSPVTVGNGGRGGRATRSRLPSVGEREPLCRRRPVPPSSPPSPSRSPGVTFDGVDNPTWAARSRRDALVRAAGPRSERQHQRPDPARAGGQRHGTITLEPTIADWNRSADRWPAARPHGAPGTRRHRARRRPRRPGPDRQRHRDPRSGGREVLRDGARRPAAAPPGQVDKSKQPIV